MKQILIIAALAVAGLAHAADPAAIALTPSEIRWSAAGTMALPGLEQAVLLGDPTKPGPYTIRLKFPAGYKMLAHSHPDSREVTILKGEWQTGYGDKFDVAGLKKLPAGSWYTEPAGVPHYIYTAVPTEIQVSGMGPSGRAFVEHAAH